MYRRILVAVENSPADKTILTHVSELARATLAMFTEGTRLTPDDIKRPGYYNRATFEPRSVSVFEHLLRGESVESTA